MTIQRRQRGAHRSVTTMKLMYLGSAAAEGWPGMFCECEACKEAARRGGRDLRMRTGSILDDEVLIDFTPDLMAQKIRFDLPLYRIRHCFITHTHSDHFDARNIAWFGPGFANINEREARGILHFYGSETSCAEMKRLIETECQGNPALCDVTPLKLYERFELGGRGFTPIPAVHGCPGAVNYIIDEGGRRLLYAHDTGIWQEETWEFLRGQRMDLVSLDCTNGPLKSNYSGHMGFERNEYVKDRMLKQGTADARTRFVINHFSHNCGMLYDDIVKEMCPKGFEVGFDGMTMTI